MKLVYICSPLHGDIMGNIKKANEYCAAAAHFGVVPLAPHTIFTKYLDDNIPDQRERGLAMGLELLSRCDEIWVCGNIITPGMRNEIQFAKEHGIPINYIKEVSDLMMSKKLHTQKSTILQQYQPMYTAYYNITVDKSLGNIAKVVFDSGKEVMVDGARHALDFFKMETSELKLAVDKIIHPLIEAEQDNLFNQLELNQYKRIYPIKDVALPYFTLLQSDAVRLAYCPIAQEEKFALLILNDFGKPFFGIDDRMFGTYDNRLVSFPFEDAEISSAQVVEALKELEPVAVYEYQKQIVIDKLDHILQESGARPFVFTGDESTPSFVSLPAEVKDYLTPEEMAIAEELVLQHNAPDQAQVETDLQDAPEQEDEEFSEDLDEEMEMCM